ncbi:methyltransferase [Aquibium carbonis]|uniref:Methyltransferase n=1 Tax=Aquibium carbonis TaxID=2495581 RepID=A0A3S0A625_9HYPH|nr:methyltransferase [Aquibium carbonis]RST84698.1 methyltransferase [Aquibium carbonis]
MRPSSDRSVPPGRGASLRDRFLDWKARLIADSGFRRFAARFLPTRFIARRAAGELFDLTAGFVYSQVLAAFVQLRLPDYLHAAPRDLQEVAARTQLSPDRAERLLNAAAALKLARRRSDGRWALGDLGAALVGNGGVTAMIEHHRLLYDDLRDPIGLLTGDGETSLSRFWSYAARDPADAAEATRYSKLMEASQAFVAEEVLDALPLSRHHRLMDVGGGTGTFVAAVATREPSIGLMLADLPDVVALARERLAAQGLAARVRLHGVNVLCEALPHGADIITLNRVLHDHDDANALAILKVARAALPPGGTLVVAEPMAGTPGAERAGHAYFGFYLLAMRQGRPRSFDEIARLAAAAGMRGVREHPTATPLLVRVLSAQA